MLRKDREYFVQGCKVHRAETTEALTKRFDIIAAWSARFTARCSVSIQGGARRGADIHGDVRTLARLHGARVVEIILALSWAHIVVAHKEARACI